MIPIRSNVQTRAALKRRGVGLRARSGVEAALRLAGQVVLYNDDTYTLYRRPARLRLMAGQVVLYNDVINTHNRPDSSRPQAARSRVACANRCGRGHCPLQPHNTDSIGTTCFLRESMCGKKQVLPVTSTLNACRMVSASPRKSSCVPSRSTSVSISSIMS